jgi:hypothetical protein
MPNKSSRPDNDEAHVGNEAIPMAPIDLARGYAGLAFRVNHTLDQELPKLRAELDETKGISLAAHGIAGRVEARLEDVARAVGAAPVKTRSIPPAPLTEKLEVQVTQSPTGTHWVMDHAELARVQEKIREKEAEERGAKEALIKLQAQEELRAKSEERTRNKYLFYMGVLVPIVGAITYVFEHFVVHVK